MASVGDPVRILEKVKMRIRSLRKNFLEPSTKYRLRACPMRGKNSSENFRAIQKSNRRAFQKNQRMYDCKTLQSDLDFFELRVLLDLGDGAVERRAVAFVLPVGHVLGHFVGVSHPSPPIMCGSGPLLLPPNQRIVT